MCLTILRIIQDLGEKNIYPWLFPLGNKWPGADQPALLGYGDGNCVS